MNKTITRIVICLLAAMALTGCPSTMNMKTVEVDSPRPAEIAVPSSVANLLIIDRTVYTGNPFDSNEAILTRQVPGKTRDAVQELMFYLQSYLGGSPRFQTVVASEALAGNSFNREFPRQIPWETVEALCRRYQTDALVAVEVYSSDFDVSSIRPASAMQRSMHEDRQRTVLEDPRDTMLNYRPEYLYAVSGTANLMFGFRVYDPATKTIIDEEMHRQRESWDATGTDPAEAMANLIREEDAIIQLIHQAGTDYARRIAPIPVPVTRKYYGESSNAPAMAAGAKLAEEDKWLEAAAAWEAGIGEAPKKEAGQLAYNVAIANEKLGRTEQAQAWAKKAYEEFGNGQARTYLAALEDEKEEKKDTLDINPGGQIQLPGVNVGTE